MRPILLLLAFLAGCTAFDRVRVNDDAGAPAWAAPPATEPYERLPLPSGFRDGLA